MLVTIKSSAFLQSITIVFLIFFSFALTPEDFQTVYERSKGKKTATYEETIAYYQALANKFDGRYWHGRRMRSYAALFGH